ncbi:MAG: hypothetical protein KGZ39_00510 [Simkania sp.]|nr:hypothetical protein [Simkania sp.]
MLFRLLLLVIVFPSSVFCNPSHEQAPSEMDGEPNLLVGDIVDPFTGSCFLHTEDLRVEGFVPIVIEKTYISDDYDKENKGWHFSSYLELNYYTNIIEEDGDEILYEECLAVVPERSGGFVYYKTTDRKRFEIDFVRHNNGFINRNGGSISARTNLKNQRLEFDGKRTFCVKTSDGGERIYVGKDRGSYSFYLQEERLPNGCWYLYSYDKKMRITNIRSTNPSKTKTFAWVHFIYESTSYKHPNFFIEASDGRRLYYRFTGSQYLIETDSPETPKERFEYRKTSHRSKLLEKKSLPSGNWTQFHYYSKGINQVGDLQIRLSSSTDNRCNRIKMLEFSGGSLEETNPAYQFIYQGDSKYKNITEVLDPQGNKTIYSYDDKGKPLSITQYVLENGRLNFSNKWTFAYGSGQPHGEHELIACSIETSYQNVNSSRTYLYDTYGNVLEKRIWGNLSGRSGAPLNLNDKYLPVTNGCETYTTKYAYSKEHLLIRSEEENGLVVTYEYLPGTTLLSAKYTWDRHRLLRREFIQYNEDNIPICHIEDDGKDPNPEIFRDVLYRKILRIRPKQEMPACGLPEQIDEFMMERSSGKEVLLKRTLIHYDDHGYVIKRDIFDAQEKYSHSLGYERDEKGRIIKEIDPFGAAKLYAYDVDGFKIRETTPSGKKTMHSMYDSRGHLCATVDATTDGMSHKTTIIHDQLGHPTHIIDYLGHEISLTVDAFGHPLATCLPDKTSSFLRTFNALGHELTYCDPEGNLKKTEYNARGSTTQVTYPNGYTEEWSYDPNGMLKESIDCEGNRQIFEYDALGRKLSHSFVDVHGNLLKKEQYTYDSFFLREHIDVAGNCTRFDYDEAGRKIHQVGIQETFYAYDELGRLQKTIHGESSTLCVYDLVDRAVEEKEETLNGELLSHRKTIYDLDGQVIEQWAWNGTWDIEKTYLYDGLGRIIEETDACGRVISTTYDESCLDPQGNTLLRVITTAPNGVRTIETRDLFDRPSHIEQIGIADALLSRVEYAYNSRGLKTQEITTQVTPASSMSQQCVVRDWDCMGRLVCLKEAAGTEYQRNTQYTYTPRGQLSSICKPDGVLISMKYDPLGRCISKKSSDGTIDYRYHYNLLDEVLSIEDRVHQLTSYRDYDSWGRLIAETLATGIGTQVSYDTLGRRSTFILPDESSIVYRYDHTYLREVARIDGEGKECYTHRYSTYDALRRVISSELPFNLGKEQCCYDPLGRIMEKRSPYFFQAVLKQDLIGNVLKIAIDNSTKNYEYDELSRVIQEPQHKYSFDSVHNRRSKDEQLYTVDALNRLHSSTEVSFTYDANGNSVVRNSPQEEIHFSYDALGRLIAAEKASVWRMEYYYDAWHRRLCSTVYHFDQGTWQEKDRVYYLWDHECEIGACDQEGKIKELRVLGLGGDSERNRTLAMELQGKIYIPMHDLCGNVYRLIDGATRKTIETYSYTVFGEGKAFSRCGNPWKFSGKRYDPLTGLVYFGKRYYCPKEGRWLTPDPRGLSAGVNLYAFVRNNPLQFYDDFGEWERDDVFRDVVGERDARGRLIDNWAGSPLANVTVASQELIHLMGSCFTAMGLHAIPDFLGGGALRFAGDYMQTVCDPRLLDRYPHLRDAYPEADSKSQILRFGDQNASDLVRISIVNGILNRRSEAQKLGREVSKLHNNCLVYLCYNATHGIFVDTVDAALEKCDVKTHASKLLTGLWHSLIQEMGGVNGSGKIVHYAHSEGGIITACSLKRLSQSERKMIEVYTFGSASLFDSNLAGLVRHHVSVRDPIPLTDLIGYGRALFSNDGSVKFVGDFYGLPFDHALTGDTYWRTLSRLADTFNEYYGCPQ